MPGCTHRLNDDPSALCCTRDAHDGTGHTYTASAGPDLSGEDFGDDE